MRVGATANLGRDPKRLTAFSSQARQQPFAVTVAVYVGGIEEIDAQLERAM